MKFVPKMSEAKIKELNAVYKTEGGLCEDYIPGSNHCIKYHACVREKIVGDYKVVCGGKGNLRIKDNKASDDGVIANFVSGFSNIKEAYRFVVSPWGIGLIIILAIIF